MFSHMKRHNALKEGYIVEQHFASVDFSIIKLVNDASQMNVAANDGSGLVGRLTSVDLIVNVGAVELR